MPPGARTRTDLFPNGCYWTYWVTDTLLIATVFSIGTALVGVGIARGAAITVVQMLVLTTYYWSLSPIGLPDSPEWLDLQHTWVTGPPVHFGVYYLGYLTALWLWRRRSAARREAGTADLERHAGDGRIAKDALAALVTALAIVVVLGLAQTVVLGELPGVTWFVMRIVVLAPFVLGWWTFAGRDRSAAIVGGAVAATLLVAYGHYLGPVGLPATDLRVLAQDPPPADVHWLSFTDEFLVVAPIAVVVCLAGFLIASRFAGHRWTALGVSRGTAAVSLAALVVIVAAGTAVARSAGAEDRSTTVTAAGDTAVEVGPAFAGEFATAEGELRFTVTQNNTKRTPLPPHDAVDLRASIDHPDGTRFDITATNEMVSEPAGRFTTWGGVGFDRWHHGRSGIGTPDVQATRSEAALWALGEVRADGELVATGVPIHAMTVDGGGAELHVGDGETALPVVPESHLRAVWAEREGMSPEGPERARHLLGGVVLLALIGAALAAARAEERAR